jgi:hypothetical protein
MERPTFLNRPAVRKQIRTRSLSEHFTVNRPETTREITTYFEERRKRLNVVKTTTTPSGQILDWIPIESQFPGGKVPRPGGDDDAAGAPPRQAAEAGKLRVRRSGGGSWPAGNHPCRAQGFFQDPRRRVIEDIP